MDYGESRGVDITMFLSFNRKLTMSTFKIIFIISILLTFAYNLTANAQTTQKLDVTINEADGDVEIMPPNTFQWIPVPSEAGSIFSEGTQIRTGPSTRRSWAGTRFHRPACRAAIGKWPPISSWRWSRHPIGRAVCGRRQTSTCASACN